MAQSGWNASGGGGGRRQKVSDYLRAVNEWRQNYTTQIGKSIREFSEEYSGDVPGSYPDVAEAARAGEGKMILFPSYAKRVAVKKDRDSSGAGQANQQLSHSSAEDHEPPVPDSGRMVTDRWQDDKDSEAIIDIDVHGWMYLPQRGAMGRKNRLMIALARRLTGIPAPPAPGNGAGESPDKMGAAGSSEEEAVAHQAQIIVNETNRRRQMSAAVHDDIPYPRRASTAPSLSSTPSWGSTVHMSRDELADANKTLMERLGPFLAQPIADVPVSVFFYNEERSQLRNIFTDELGHFYVRTGLRFVPTHIRVLAFENLSLSKEVRVVQPAGVSMISDIDDTVKRSGIIMGAKEVCRNTFVRDLAEMCVDGVSEWYGKMANMGVQFHYVSNSPWQLYSLLEQFFKVSGLPPGSVHLKQYSGMLMMQGMFESAAERKRSSLDKILRDFPRRKFVLVGDSGEGDLEVYTEIALSYPGRILAIFIRDVVAAEQQKKLMDRSVNNLQETQSWSRSTGHILPPPPLPTTDADEEKKRPTLPPRRQTPSPARSLDNADLIDLEDTSHEHPPPPPPKKTVEGGKEGSTQRPAAPARPFKPSSLRNVELQKEDSTGPGADQSSSSENQKTVPPPPRRRDNNLVSVEAQSSSTPRSMDNPSTGKPTAEESQTKRSTPPPAPPPRRSKAPSASASASASPTRADMEAGSMRPAPPPPAPSQQHQQPPKHSSPLAAASPTPPSASERSSPGPPQSTNPGNLRLPQRTGTNMSVQGIRDEDAGAQGPGQNRRDVESWRRRWEEAKDVLDEHGVILGSWRVGSDVNDVCEWLVREELDRQHSA